MKYFIAVVCFAAFVAARPSKECMENKPSIKPSECCTGANLYDTTILSECEKQHNESSTDDVQRHHHHKFKFGCIGECYLNKTGILKNGNIDSATAISQYTKNADSSLQSVIKTAVDECIKKDQEMQQRFGDKSISSEEDSVDRKRCHPKSAFFMFCVDKKVFANCPADKKKTTDECKKLEEFEEKCKPPHRH